MDRLLMNPMLAPGVPDREVASLRDAARTG